MKFQTVYVLQLQILIDHTYIPMTVAMSHIKDIRTSPAVKGCLRDRSFETQ